MNVETVKLSDGLRERARTVTHDIIQELALQQPQDMKFAIWVTLDRVQDRSVLSTADIEQIELDVSRPRLSPPRSELYDYYLNYYMASNMENPFFSALAMTNVADGDIAYSWKLRKLINATAENSSPELKKRLAAILNKLGNKQKNFGTLSELILGTPLIHSAAEITNDKKLKDDAQMLREYASRLVQATYSPYPAFFWPIRPLVIDAVRLSIQDEIYLHTLFTDAAIPVELLNRAEKE